MQMAHFFSSIRTDEWRKCDLIKSFHALRKEIEPNRSMTEKLS
jgi:hypothetical protein